MLSNRSKLATAIVLAIVGAGASQNAAAFAFGLGASEIDNFAITTTGSVSISTGNVRGLATAAKGGGATAADSCAVGFGSACDLFAKLGDSTYANDTFLVNKNDGTNWALTDGLVPDATKSTLFSSTKASQSTPWLSNGSYALAQTFTVNVGSSGTLQFDFDAFTELEAELNGGSTNGSQAQGSFGFQITLTRSGGGRVFEWSPDGLAGNITGGTESLDPFTLNDTLALLDMDDSQSRSNGAGSFSAVTDSLAAGTYFLSVFQSTESNSQWVSAVPEPASLSLIGLGLLGAGALRARRQAKG